MTTTHFADTVLATRIGNGLVRLQFGVLEGVEGQEKPAPKPAFELVLPLAGFGDLANICSRVAAELVAKGVFTKNESDVKTVEEKK
jgi:hypothetical protein